MSCLQIRNIRPSYKTIVYSKKPNIDFKIYRGGVLLWTWFNGTPKKDVITNDTVLSRRTSTHTATWNQQDNNSDPVGFGAYTVHSEINVSPLLSPEVPEPPPAAFTIQ